MELSRKRAIGHTSGMNAKPLYRRHRFPPDIIRYAVCLYHRFALKLRDIQALLARRGAILSDEMVRRW
jgi:putative transposase